MILVTTITTKKLIEELEKYPGHDVIFTAEGEWNPIEFVYPQVWCGGKVLVLSTEKEGKDD